MIWVLNSGFFFVCDCSTLLSQWIECSAFCDLRIVFCVFDFFLFFFTCPGVSLSSSDWISNEYSYPYFCVCVYNYLLKLSQAHVFILIIFWNVEWFQDVCSVHLRRLFVLDYCTFARASDGADLFSPLILVRFLFIFVYFSIYSPAFLLVFISLFLISYFRASCFIKVMHRQYTCSCCSVRNNAQY